MKIVTCPDCDTRFNVEPEMLGEDGRKVRCGECFFEWFQPNIDDEEDIEGLADEDEDVAFIDLVEDHEPPPVRIQETRTEENYPREVKKVGHKGGRIAAGLLFLSVLGGLFFFKSEITSAWSDTYAVYDLLQKQPNMLDKNDISFEHFKVLQDGQTLFLKGLIYNLRSEEISLPPIFITLYDANRNKVDEIFISMEENTIAEEDTLTLEKEIKLETEQIINTIHLRPLSFIDEVQSNVSSAG